jgi:glucose/arabinose dehydrogenase
MRARSIMRIAIAIVLGSFLAGCGKNPASGPGRREAGKSVETQPPNARDQQPAVAGQTRAPFRTANVAFEAKTIAKDLDHPWAVAFLDNDTFLVTEKRGRLLLLARDGTRKEIAGVPEVDDRGQGGLLDVALDPDFAENRVVFFTFSEPRDGGNGTALARAVLDRERGRLDDVQVIWRQKPTLDSKLHFGSRIVFRKDGTLFVTLGERSILEGRRQAQRLDSAFGKIVRLHRDGRIPDDNPFAGKQSALPEIWSFGHRNIQAAALHPETGELWVVDHGPRGGDEINIARAGKDYGWPTITYGLEYSGEPVGAGITQKAGMEQPLYYWDPVIAPSGAAFYTGALFPAWRGSLFVGGLAGKHVARLTLDGERVVGEERLLADRARFRDVRVGPDGAIYLLTDESDGELLALVPRERAQVGALPPPAR